MFEKAIEILLAHMSKEEFIKFDEELDEDMEDNFPHMIRQATVKLAPELFNRN